MAEISKTINYRQSNLNDVNLWVDPQSKCANPWPINSYVDVDVLSFRCPELIEHDLVSHDFIHHAG